MEDFVLLDFDNINVDGTMFDKLGFGWSEEEPAARQVFAAYGPLLDFFTNREPVVAITGAAGTGKTRTILEKIHKLCEKYAGTKIAICREQRVDLNESALKTYEEEVLPAGHPVLSGASRRYRSEYVYPNGSRIVLFGLQQSKKKESEGGGAAKLTSTFWHMIYIVEANETTYDKFITAKTRCREFNGTMPYRQMVIDFNPVLSSHWIYRAEKEGIMKIYKTYHHDNPLWFNQSDPTGGVIHPRTGKPGSWTPEGTEYVLNNLGRLTGNLRKRFFLGIPMSPEGSIYPEFTDDHIVRSLLLELSARVTGIPIPGHPKYDQSVPDEERLTPLQAYVWLDTTYSFLISCDWGGGGGHPLVHQLWAIKKGDKRRPSRLIAELYNSTMITSDSGKMFINWLGWEYVSDREEDRHPSEERQGGKAYPRQNDLGFPIPIYSIEDGYQNCECVTDVSLESRELWRRVTGIEPEVAVKAVNNGIEATKRRMKELLIEFDDIEVIGGVDETLSEKGHPTRTTEEIVGYRWQKATLNQSVQKPVKVKDDGCDTMKYAMARIDDVEGEDIDVSKVSRTESVEDMLAYINHIYADDRVSNAQKPIEQVVFSTFVREDVSREEQSLFSFTSSRPLF